MLVLLSLFTTTLGQRGGVPGVDHPLVGTQNWIRCDDPALCHFGHVYKPKAGRGGKEFVITRTVGRSGICAQGDSWFSKMAGEISTGKEEDSYGGKRNLHNFCQDMGFDTVGAVYSHLPANMDWMVEHNEAAVLCNKYRAISNFGQKDSFKQMTGTSATFECVNLQKKRVLTCCQGNKWSGQCYNKRGYFNNFQTCSAIHGRDGPVCFEECDNGDVEANAGTAECYECCKNKDKDTPWNCNADQYKEWPTFGKVTYIRGGREVVEDFVRNNPVVGAGAVAALAVMGVAVSVYRSKATDEYREIDM